METFQNTRRTKLLVLQPAGWEWYCTKNNLPRTRRSHTANARHRRSESAVFFCALRATPRAWPLTAAAYQLDSSSQWQNKCLHAAPNASAKAQCGRVERSRHCRSSTLHSELWSSCHRSSQRCIRSCRRTALEMEAPKAFQVTRQTGEHNVQGDGPPLGAEGWFLWRRIGSPGASGLGLQSRRCWATGCHDVYCIVGRTKGNSMAVQGAEGAEGAGMKSWFAVDACCRSSLYIIVQRFGDTQVLIEAVDLVNSGFAVDWTRSIWNILPSCPVNARERISSLYSFCP